MKIYCKTVTFNTEKELQFIDCTEKIKKIISKANIKEGFVNIFSKHTTLALKINENEKLLMNDFAYFLKKIIPNKKYSHDNISLRENCSPSEPKNAKAHLKTILLETSQFIPIHKKILVLGKWQRIFLIETCGPRRREIVIQIMGN